MEETTGIKKLSASRDRFAPRSSFPEYGNTLNYEDIASCRMNISEKGITFSNGSPIECNHRYIFVVKNNGEIFGCKARTPIIQNNGQRRTIFHTDFLLDENEVIKNAGCLYVDSDGTYHLDNLTGHMKIRPTQLTQRHFEDFRDLMVSTQTKVFRDPLRNYPRFQRQKADQIDEELFREHLVNKVQYTRYNLLQIEDDCSLSDYAIDQYGRYKEGTRNQATAILGEEVLLANIFQNTVDTSCSIAHPKFPVNYRFVKFVTRQADEKTLALLIEKMSVTDTLLDVEYKFLQKTLFETKFEIMPYEWVQNDWRTLIVPKVVNFLNTALVQYRQHTSLIEGMLEIDELSKAEYKFLCKIKTEFEIMPYEGIDDWKSLIKQNAVDYLQTALLKYRQASTPCANDGDNYSYELSIQESCEAARFDDPFAAPIGYDPLNPPPGYDELEPPLVEKTGVSSFKLYTKKPPYSSEQKKRRDCSVTKKLQPKKSKFCLVYPPGSGQEYTGCQDELRLYLEQYTPPTR